MAIRGSKRTISILRITIIGLLIAGIFVVDWSLPQRYGVSEIYLVPTLLTVTQRSRVLTLSVTIICVTLTLIHAILHFTINPADISLALIEVLSGAGAAILAVRYVTLMRDEDFARRRAETLSELGQHIRHTADVDSIYDYAVEAVGQILDVHRVYIMPITAEFGDVEHTIQHEWRRNGVSSVKNVPLPPPRPGSVRSLDWSGRYITINDAKRDSRITPVAQEKFNIRASVVARIFVAGYSVALLSVHDCRAPRRWKQAELDLISGVADQVSIAAEEALLTKRVADQSATLDFVFENAPIGIAIVNHAGVVDRYNRFLAMIMRSLPETVIGKPLTDVHPELGEVFARFGDLVFTGKTVLNRDMRIRIEGSLDAVNDFRVSLFPIWHGGDQVAQIGMVIEDTTNERRIQRETVLSLARERRVNATLQKTLLPALPPQLASIQTGLIYRPAASDRGIGGDFLDIVPLEDGRIAVFIGDVTGHGIEAAAQTSLIKNVLRAYSLLGEAPAETISRLNAALLHQFQFDTLVTLFYGILTPETGQLVYASAGHEPPLVVHAKGQSIQMLTPTGTVVGLDAYSIFDEGECMLDPDDVLVLLTDGFVEARCTTKPDILGEAKFQKCLVSAVRSASTLQQTADEVWNFVVSEMGSSYLEDDAALLLISVLPLSGIKGGSTRLNERVPHHAVAHRN